MNNDGVSIIIPFVKWNDYIEQCVKNCLKIEGVKYEIILVPDEKIIIKKDKKLKIVVSGKKNISQKRNMGVRESSKNFKFFAFIDSDAYPRKDWLKNALSKFSDGYDVVGGPNITPPDDNLMQRCTGNILKSFFCGGPRSYQTNEKSVSRQCNDTPTCNMVVKKSAMGKTRFDETLETGEDLKFCYDIKKSGGKVFFSDDVVVFHHRRRLFMPFLWQRYTYGKSVPRIMKKDMSKNNIYLMGPMLLFLLITIGALTIYIDPIPYISIALLFLIVSAIESARFSRSLKELPFTYVGFICGVLVPGIGTISAFIKPSYSVGKRYSNHGKIKKC